MSMRSKQTRIFILHPFLLGLFFVLYGVNQYESLFVETKEVLLLILMSWGLGALLFFGFRLMCRQSLKAALLASVSLVSIFFYFHFYHQITQWTGWSFLQRHRYFLVIFLLINVVLVWRIIRSKWTFSVLNQYLNTLFIALVVFEAGKAIWGYYQSQKWFPAIQDEYLNYQGQDFAKDNLKPDVYHILLDAYTGFDALEKYWDYDNAAFKSYLKNKNFYVAEHAQGNYAHTRQVLPTMMNRDYFWDLDESGKERVSAYLIALSGIRHAKTYKDFEAMGYELVNLSIFDMLDKPGFYEHSGIPATSFRGFMLRKTVFDVFFLQKRQWTHYEAAKKVIKRVKSIAATPAKQPRYVYAHLMLPHYPYYFDKNGRLHLDRENPKHWSNQEHYLEQLIYTNQLIQEMIDDILENSQTAPVIIVHGDHGFRFLEGEAKDEAGYSVLAAFHFPSQQYEALSDSISPVNFYRALLNVEFGTSFELLEDKREFFRSTGK